MNCREKTHVGPLTQEPMQEMVQIPNAKVGMCQFIVKYMDAGRLLASSESIRRGHAARHAALLSNYCGSHLSRINFTALVIVYSMNNKLKIQPC